MRPLGGEGPHGEPGAEEAEVAPRNSARAAACCHQEPHCTTGRGGAPDPLGAVGIRGHGGETRRGMGTFLMMAGTWVYDQPEPKKSAMNMAYFMK